MVKIICKSYSTTNRHIIEVEAQYEFFFQFHINTISHTVRGRDLYNANSVCYFPTVQNDMLVEFEDLPVCTCVFGLKSE